MSAADKRIADLLDRWLTSVELHADYLKLDNEAYARVQKWPEHERPSRWVIDLARTRIEELRSQVVRRSEKGDVDFADALELMSFLTCLLGAEQVDRFIPLAKPRRAESKAPPEESALELEPQPQPTPDPEPASGRAESVMPAEPPAKKPAAKPPAAKPPAAKPPAAKPPAGAKASAAPPKTTPGSARKSSQGSRSAAPARAPAGKPAAEQAAATRKVINDAVRLLKWGSEWPQLAGLVARLADRPPEPEVWQILRDHRATIEARASQDND
jgi:hypothetical protein